MLSLLDDVDVRQKILAVTNQQKEDTQNVGDEERKQTNRLPRELNAERKRADKLQREVDAWKEKFNAERKRAKMLQTDGDAWIRQYEQQQRRANELQGKLEMWIKKFNDEQERSEKIQEELDDAEDKLSRLEDFTLGFELYQKYQGIGYHARQLLSAGVFSHDGFKSFICGGAQTNSLETIWDVWRECVMGGKNQDAEVLGEVFKYCLELVNASKVQASYSILPVKVGDRFDSDIHVEGPGSRAQGKISAVYLPGYLNNYNRRIIRKSIVKVG